MRFRGKQITDQDLNFLRTRFFAFFKIKKQNKFTGRNIFCGPTVDFTGI
jgi:hypothetical protein